jgi:hypothetical protein
MREEKQSLHDETGTLFSFASQVSLMRTTEHRTNMVFD